MIKKAFFALIVAAVLAMAAFMEDGTAAVGMAAVGAAADGAAADGVHQLWA
ncbi:hypothetical protein ACVIW2_008368 [Bradyrhizobium huanghuaihaiense]|uniref:Uncharacterized protein n=1 Tax=Bradyrhizobium huanghuaihaiense TaxID=990078 RepID=A0A562RI73_9BRAD|nr:hypothetical protein [Bradyrhizobium huanghuaihaiense]TWI68254.1 hypothetical protein IQ16_04098 [Bradyrhizobium huanghuaihaiense]